MFVAHKASFEQAAATQRLFNKYNDHPQMPFDDAWLVADDTSGGVPGSGHKAMRKLSAAVEAGHVLTAEELENVRRAVMLGHRVPENLRLLVPGQVTYWH